MRAKLAVAVEVIALTEKMQIKRRKTRVFEAAELLQRRPARGRNTFPFFQNPGLFFQGRTPAGTVSVPR